MGDKLLEELYTFPVGLSKELEKAIDDFYAQKKARDAKYKELQTLAAGASVKAFAAKNELAQMDSADKTETNRMELTLQAAKRKAEKTSADQLLHQKEKAAADEDKAKREASRARLSAIASKFQ